MKKLKDALTIIGLGDFWITPTKNENHWLDQLINMFPEHIYCNLGENKDSTIDVLEKLEKDVFSFHPDIVIISVGMNDFFLESDIEYGANKAFERAVKIIKKCKKSGINVLMCGYGKMGFEDVRFNHFLSIYLNKLKDYCKNNSIEYVSAFDIEKFEYEKNHSFYKQDKMHLSDDGNRQYAKLLAVPLERVINDKIKEYEDSDAKKKLIFLFVEILIIFLLFFFIFSHII